MLRINRSSASSVMRKVFSQRRLPFPSLLGKGPGDGVGNYIFAVALMLVTGIATAADDAPAPVTIQLQWMTQAQFAGYYAANELGFYEEEGLAVTLLESDGDIQPADTVAAGDAEFGRHLVAEDPDRQREGRGPRQYRANLSAQRHRPGFLRRNGH